MSTDTVGGVWSYSLDLAKELVKEGNTVVLLSMGPSPTVGQYLDVKEIKGISFYHKTCKLEWMDDPWEDVASAGEWIWDIYKKENPALIHFNHYAHVDMGWECPVILVAHSCVATWWSAVKKETLPSHYQIYFRKVKKAMNAADCVVSPSYAMKKEYENLYGQLKVSKVIYNGSKPPSARPVEKCPIIFSMGRLWDEAKNLDLLLKAAPDIDTSIFIAGDKQVDYEIPANVTFLGKLSREEVHFWLKKSSIYVLPVKYEPFGLSFLEAAMYGCAVVGGDIPTLKEIWQDNICYTPPDNPSILTRHCNQLIKDRRYRKVMKIRATQRSEYFTLQNMKNQYLKAYQEVLGRVEVV